MSMYISYSSVIRHPNCICKNMNKIKVKILNVHLLRDLLQNKANKNRSKKNNNKILNINTITIIII